MIKRCCMCRKFYLGKNVIYVKMSGGEKSGYWCLTCLKAYMLSSIKDIKEYVNSRRFRDDPNFMEMLEQVKNILHNSRL